MNFKTSAFHFIAWVSILFSSPLAFATHYMGGEITYECLGSDSYRVTLNVYRDCAGSPMAASQRIDISSASCGISNQATLQLLSSSEVSPLCPSSISNSTCSGGTLPGAEQYVYQGEITLSTQCEDWILSRSFANRNDAITNLFDGGNQTMYIEAQINNSDPSYCNNSPVFTNLPVPFICEENLFNYNHGAVDSDGDELQFELINPLGEGGVALQYNTGHTVLEPIGSSTAMNFNLSNGSMIFNPSPNQVAVITVRVNEYRNGDLIGSIMRDVQIVTLSCTNDPPQLSSNGFANVTGATVLSKNELELCPGQDMEFDLTFSDVDALDELSLSTSIETVLDGATVTTTGTNPLSVHVEWTPQGGNTGLKSFTTEIKDDACPSPGVQVYAFNINVLSGTSAGPDIYYCIGNDPPQLKATGGTSFAWSPATGLSCTTCADPIATPAVTTTYSLVSNLSGACSNTDEVTVFVVEGVPVSTSSISGPDGMCPSATVFTYEVDNTTGSNYQWNVPKGGQIISGQGSNQISVRWIDNVNAEISVIETNSQNCKGDEVELTLDISGPPSNPITGPIFICKESLSAEGGQNYSTTGPTSTPNNPPTPGSGMSHYEWSTDLGTAIFDQNAITAGRKDMANVKFTNYAGPVILKVVEIDDEGCRHTPATLEIDVVAKPRTTPSIIGPTRLCPGDTVQFSVNSPTDNFLWNFGTPASGIDIIAGDSTKSVTVVWGETSQRVETNEGIPGCVGNNKGGINVQIDPLKIQNLNNGFSSCNSPFTVKLDYSDNFKDGTQQWLVSRGYNINSGGDGSSTINLTQTSPDCYSGEICIVAENTSGCVDTACTIVSGNPPPPCALPSSVPDLGSSIEMCSGDTLLKTVRENTFYYRWYKDGVPVASDVNLDSLRADELGDYKVRVADELANINDANCFLESSEITISSGVLITPTITITSDKTEICDGEEVIFSIVSRSDEGTFPVYQWNKNGLALVAENGLELTTTSLADQDKITLDLMSSENCLTSDTVVSNELLIEVVNCTLPEIDTTLYFCKDTVVLGADAHAGSYNLAMLHSSINAGNPAIDSIEFFLEDIATNPSALKLSNKTIQNFPEALLYVRSMASAGDPRGFGYSTVRIALLDKPSLTLSTIPAVCEGSENLVLNDYITISDLNFGTLSISGNAASSSFLENAATEFNLSAGSANNYFVGVKFEIDSSSCFNNDSLEITVHSLPFAPLATSGSLPFCEDISDNDLIAQVTGNFSIQIGRAHV